MDKIIVFAKENTTRLNYVLEFIFKNVLGIDCLITTSDSEFESSSYFKINYSHKNLTAHLTVDSIGLLFENEIVEKEIRVTTWNDLPIFFQTNETNIPFDIFSAIFYLISRYEEYLTYEPDTFLRFPHTQSIAYQNNFLQLPLVDLWIEELKKIMQKKQPTLHFKQAIFKYIPSYDIDIAYSFKGKSFVKNVGGGIRDLFTGKINSLKNRIEVLLFNKKDPYDSYDFLDSLHTQYQLIPIYFFLLSTGSEYDKNLPRNGKVMQQLIARISKKYTIGIHPSWNSHKHFDVLQEEVLTLKNTTHSRQHYIRFTLPETFRNLLKAGITNDYSMGYGTKNGFRASTSHSFSWFDLENNSTTSLILHPFCFMECNSFFQQKDTAQNALKEMLELLQSVRKVNGTYISIWHNFSLGSDSLWKGWKEIYIQFLQQIEKK